MMVLREENNQGILVGFEFAILDSRVSESKRVCTEFSRALEQRGAAGGSSREASSVNSELASGDVATHHVATLPLSRCMDDPPAHQFQHELESFIWSIFFIQSGFRYGRRVLNSDLEKWYVGDWESIGMDKRKFLTKATDCAAFAGQFAESLGVEPQPLMACSQLLALMLLPESEQLDAVHIASALQTAQDAYAKNELVARPS